METRLTLLPKKGRPNHATPPALAFAIVASLAALGAGIYCKTQGNAAFNARFGAADFQAAARWFDYAIALFSLGGLAGAAGSWLAPLPNPSTLKRMMALAAFVCVYSMIVLLAS